MTKRVGLLLWPTVVVATLAGALLLWVWSAERDQRQDQVIPTIVVAGSAVILLVLWTLAWLLFLSRMRWRARLAVAGGIVAVIALLPAILEIRGVSGDVLPLVGWRWAAAAAPPLPDAPAAGSSRRVAAVSSPHDFPQFQGPSRDGRVSGVRLARGWATPPRARWRRPVGAAWSGFAVAGAHAVTQEQRGDEEVVACYDLATGEPLWIHADRTRWDDPIGGPGPRATPAIHEARVYSLGGTGLLNVLDLVSGALLWSRDVLADAEASAPPYGVSASPLVLGDTVVVAAGGGRGQALVGYDARTGAPRWMGGDGGPAYGSPRLAVLAGVPQILVLNAGAVAAHDPQDGRVLWEFPWPPGSEMTFMPVVLPGDRVFVSTGYGVGGRLLQVRLGQAGPVAEQVWESLGLKAKFSNVVYHDGFLYGLDDGILVCVDPASGERRWKRGRHGHGQVLLADDLLVVLGEGGDIALVEARPEAHRELGRFAALAGKTWNHPALAGADLLVRNDREAACYELPLAGPR